MINRYFLFGFLFFLGITTQAQFTQIGEGGFESNLYGPITTSNSSQSYSRYAYIYPAGSFSNLKHGDSVVAIGFKNGLNTGLTGNNNLKIFIASSSQADFGSGSLNWLAETRDGMVKVFDGNPNSLIAPKPGFTIIQFNQANTFKFDTSGGAVHFKLLVEFTQESSETPFDWACESSFYVPAFVSNNETKYISGTGVLDSLCNVSTSIKPSLQLFFPRQEQDLEVLEIQCLASQSVLMQQSDSIKVLVRNIGKDSSNSAEAYLKISGSSNHMDTVSLIALAPLSTTEVTFANHNKVRIGEEVLVVTLGSDDNVSNNSKTLVRDITYNILSYTNSQSGNVAGLSGQDAVFAARYSCENIEKLDFVEVDFVSAGEFYQIEIFKEHTSGGSPGVSIYKSDTLTTSSGINRVSINSAIYVSGNFYVGVKVVNNSNLSLTGTLEDPLISRTFYYLQPTQDSTWKDLAYFSNYRLSIVPIITTANDVYVKEIVIPSPNDSFFYSPLDSIEIEVDIVNKGYLPQSVLNVKLEILNNFNQVVFSNTQTTSMGIGDSLTLTFEKFSRSWIGTLTARVTSESNLDLIEENSVLDATFYIVKEHDFSVNFIFEPTPADTFEVNQDGFWPRIRVFNYGANGELDVPVIFQIVQDEAILYRDTLLVSLAPEFSKIVTFDSVTLTEIGELEIRFFVVLDADSFPENDTLSAIIFSRASDDLEVDSFLKPSFQEKFEIDTNFLPKVKVVNNGVYDRLAVKIVCEIFDIEDVSVYRDSSTFTLGSFATEDITFSQFNCSVLGDYKIRSYISFDGDQYAKNDTLISFFKVVEEYDLKLVRLRDPIPDNYYLINSADVMPKIEVFNNGKKEIDSATIDLMIEDDLGMVFHDTLTASLVLDELKEFQFDSLFSFDKIGNYTVTVINKWTSEQSLSSNDTLVAEFYIRHNKDVAIDSHATPLHNGIFELAQPINPKVAIRNNGLTTMDSIEVLVQLVKDEVELRRDTLRIAHLAPKAAINLQSTKFWLMDTVGSYTLKSQLLNPDEDNRNDSFTSSFSLIKTADIKADRIVFPLESDELATQTKYEPQVWIKNDGLTYFDLFSIVAEVYIEDTLYYISTQAYDLDAGDSILVSFDSLSFNGASTNAYCLMHIAAQGDEYAYNDTLINRFTIVKSISVQKMNTYSLKVYPNPYRDYLMVESDTKIDQILLYSMDGQLVAEYFPRANNYRITEGLQGKTYLLEIISNGESATKIVLFRD